MVSNKVRASQAQRMERDWNQTDLAQSLDISRLSVSAIETGHDPSLPLATRIAALFGQPIEAVFVFLQRKMKNEK